MVEFEIIKGQRKNDLLIYEDFIYNKESNADGSVRWRCRNRSCRGFLIIDNDGNIQQTVIHSHLSVPDKVRRVKAMSSIRQRALLTSERAFDIVAPQISILNETGVDGESPSIKYMLDSVRKARNKIIGHSPDVIKDIPEILKRDNKGNLFLRYDSGFQDKERFIIFISDFKLSYLARVDTIVIDGTFKSCPQGFFQVVVIHGFIFEKTFPFIHILLSNKSESSYVRAFKKCRELVELNILYIITDFERALINAIKVIFSEAEHFGCLFHLGQAAWRRIGALEEISLFKNNAFYKKIFKMTLCLAFVPPYEVLDHYLEIKSLVQLNDEPILDNFLSYFEKNYLENFGNEEQKETELSFNIKFWNAYSRILKRIPRTSNNAESWNRTFNLRINNSHPNIAHYITCLLQMEDLDLYDLKHCLKGLFNVYLTKKEQILYNLIRNKRFFTPIEYLEALISIYYFKFEKEE